MVHKRNDGKNDEKDEARTPASLFKSLDDVYHFGVDAAASHGNHLCDAYFTKYNPIGDALSIEWYGLLPERKQPFYCNPPYSRGNVEAFCKKEERYIHGKLLSDSPDYWRLHTNGTP